MTTRANKSSRQSNPYHRTINFLSWPRLNNCSRVASASSLKVETILKLRWDLPSYSICQWVCPTALRSRQQALYCLFRKHQYSMLLLILMLSLTSLTENYFVKTARGGVSHCWRVTVCNAMSKWSKYRSGVNVSLIALMMDAARASETSVDIQLRTR
jgi:hypothetical protein